ncbi:dynamin family protein [Actinomyces slackii]|uniref:Predicted GTPase n=1 Tax=Actinomyces slackii TaxID=52774 RepID=A0A3S5EMA7_9ACTO|nr:dynamin family protein [Actinomyces slackii]VEG75335.1 Predicted GTPase [Actinomyces slackii]
MTLRPAPGPQLPQALAALGRALGALRLPYALPGAAQAADRGQLLADQLADYVLPRLASMDAPLLGVIGGSTGAGKSTLVSSLVGRPVTAASAIRPTTRRPALLHAPSDAPWFETDRILGSLARLRVAEDAPPSPAGQHTPRELELRACSALPAGLALLDAPDIDSVVAENRELAAGLLASADMWVFVTTAARYADAVPWEHLRAAAQRQVTAAVVLDRVPPGAQGEVEADLRRRLDAAGLTEAPIFTIPETALDPQGLLPAEATAPVRHWLGALAQDAAARRAVAQRTLAGAIGSALGQAEILAVEIAAQEAEHAELVQGAASAHAQALERLAQATADGSLLRGEVLARWQEFVGTGDLMRSLESHIGRLRDRLGAALRGRPAPAARVEEAIESSLVGLIVAEAQRAAMDTERSWRRSASAAPQLRAALEALPSHQALERQAISLVRLWQGEVLALVRAEGADKRLTARLVSLGVNGAGVLLMILVFAHTGGLTGGEVGIAGGTALLAQRLLEAVFGDQAMRTMTRRARADLTERVQALFAQQEGGFIQCLDAPVPASQTLRAHVEQCRSAAQDLSLDPTSTTRQEPR